MSLAVRTPSVDSTLDEIEHASSAVKIAQALCLCSVLGAGTTLALGWHEIAALFGLGLLVAMIGQAHVLRKLFRAIDKLETLSPVQKAIMYGD